MRRRRLGQHYLVDRTEISKLISLAAISKGEKVLEIGTGKGAVTSELAKVSTSLEGYEIDEDNLREAAEALGDTGVKLHLGDAFESRPSFDVLVASLPYSRSSDFVEWIARQTYDRAVVVLQKDFVDKLTAPPGHREYRAVSVIAQVSSQITEMSGVPRSAFSPQPRVNSVIASWRPRRKLNESQISAVKRLFSLRRRQVRSAIAELGGKPPTTLGERRVNGLLPEEALLVAMSLA